MSDFATSASTLANSADDSDSRDMQTDSQSVAQVKTDLGLFEDADSLSAEDLNNLAMLDPALLSEKEIAQAAQNQFDHAVQFLRHDLLRISGDIDEADRFLRDNHTSDRSPMRMRHVCCCRTLAGSARFCRSGVAGQT